MEPADNGRGSFSPSHSNVFLDILERPPNSVTQPKKIQGDGVSQKYNYIVTTKGATDIPAAFFALWAYLQYNERTTCEDKLIKKLKYVKRSYNEAEKQ